MRQTLDEKFIQSVESEEQKRLRFVNGDLSEEEIRNHWAHPSEPLFEHEILRKRGEQETKTSFRVRALSEDFKDSLLREIKGAWDDLSFEELKETIEQFFEQKKLGHPGLLNVEYYITTDHQDKPFAITGIYTKDIEDAAGFATRNQLDFSDHNLVAWLGWYSVSDKYQGTGVGGFLLDWTEKMAKSRGASMMAIETSDYEGERKAGEMYAKRGYKQGFDIKDYFGPGRDLFSYFTNVTEQGSREFIPKEEINPQNKEDILSFAQKIYSPERFEEFKVCLDLFLLQKKGESVIWEPHSFVLRGKEGITGFCIASSGVYDNGLFVNWEAAEPGKDKKDLIEAMKGYAKLADKEILIIHREGEDGSYLDSGFESGKNNNAIRGAFTKGDKTSLMFCSKKL